MIKGKNGQSKNCYGKFGKRKMEKIGCHGKFGKDEGWRDFTENVPVNKIACFHKTCNLTVIMYLFESCIIPVINAFSLPTFLWLLFKSGRDRKQRD